MIGELRGIYTLPPLLNAFEIIKIILQICYLFSEPTFITFTHTHIYIYVHNTRIIHMYIDTLLPYGNFLDMSNAFAVHISYKWLDNPYLNCFVFHRVAHEGQSRCVHHSKCIQYKRHTSWLLSNYTKYITTKYTPTIIYDECISACSNLN